MSRAQDHTALGMGNSSILHRFLPQPPPRSNGRLLQELYECRKNRQILSEKLARDIIVHRTGPGIPAGDSSWFSSSLPRLPLVVSWECQTEAVKIEMRQKAWMSITEAISWIE